MTGCTIQLWYNKQRVKKSGNASLYLQIISKSESAEIALKLEWPASKFDWPTKSLKPRFKDDPDLLVFNAAIERARAKYWAAVMDFLKEGTDFTLADLFKRVNLYSSGQTLALFMEETIKARLRADDIENRIKPDTAKSHRTVVKVIRDYTRGKDVAISAVDAAWLRKFANNEREHLCENSVWTRIKIIKTYLSIARKQHMDVNADYRQFKIKMDTPDPTWLDEDEIKKLLEKYRDPKTPQGVIRILKAFLFACFTGMRISDLSRWNKSWVADGVISFIPKKRKLSRRKPKPVTIPIIPIAQEFIDDLEGESFELPTEQAYNRELKLVAEKAGINKVITSHVARHTFATWLAIDGVPTIVISSLLGHADVKTTMIYVHVAEKYKAVEMIKMQKRFGDKAIS